MTGPIAPTLRTALGLGGIRDLDAESIGSAS